jgi:hypothetical protein
MIQSVKVSIAAAIPGTNVKVNFVVKLSSIQQHKVKSLFFVSEFNVGRFRFVINLAFDNWIPKVSDLPAIPHFLHNNFA